MKQITQVFLEGEGPTLKPPMSFVLFSLNIDKEVCFYQSGFQLGPDSTIEVHDMIFSSDPFLQSLLFAIIWKCFKLKVFFQTWNMSYTKGEDR